MSARCTAQISQPVGSYYSWYLVDVIGASMNVGAPVAAVCSLAVTTVDTIDVIGGCLT